MTRISAIVLNWNQPDLTIQTVNSLIKSLTPYQQYRIFIIDNHSSDKSFSILKKHYQRYSRIVIRRTPANLGYVGGNNFGFTLARKYRPDYYLVLNNDTKCDVNFVKNLLSATRSHPQVGIFGPKIYFAPGYEYHKDRYGKKDIGKVIWSAGGKFDWNNIDGPNIGIDEVDHGQYDQINPNLDYISGCAMLIRRQLVEKIGFFDPDYFLYLEDVDYSTRTLRSGYKLLYVPSSFIWHYNSASSGAASALHDYFLTRNRLLLGFKYASLKTKFALFRQSIRIFLTTPSIWQKRGVKDYYLGKLGKGSWQ